MEAVAPDTDRTGARTEGGDISEGLSFEEFFEESSVRAYRLAFTILGDREAAEDATQDAFAAVYSRWGRVRDPERYLTRAVANKCRDRIRSNQRHRRLVDRLRREPSRPEPSGGDGLDDLLAGLTAGQRIAVVLRVHYGLTDREIARATGWPLGTAKSHIRRGLTHLTEGLG